MEKKVSEVEKDIKKAEKEIENIKTATKEIDGMIKIVEDTKKKPEEKKETKPEKKVKEDEVILGEMGLVKLKPTKLKYFKNGKYNNFMLIKNMPINELLRYDDGEEVIENFILAALDLEKITEEFVDSLSIVDLYELIEKINKINGIKEEDFLKKTESQVVTKE